MKLGLWDDDQYEGFYDPRLDPISPAFDIRSWILSELEETD